jgi:peptidoglycan/LPS O-acetylase OafA/YrhL
MAVFNEWYQQQDRKFSQKTLSILGFLGLGTMLLLMPNAYNLITNLEHRLIRGQNFTFRGFLFGLFIFVVINEKGVLNRVFSHRSIRLIGIVSFSLYIWHIFVLRWAINLNASTSIKILGYYLVSLLIAVVSFLVFEKPFFKMRVNRTKKQPASAPLSLLENENSSDSLGIQRP